MWQHVRTETKVLQHVWNLWPFCANPICPDPVWKPVSALMPVCARAGGSGRSDGRERVIWVALPVNATCLIRPRLLFAFFAASRITMMCCIIRHF